MFVTVKVDTTVTRTVLSGAQVPDAALMKIPPSSVGSSGLS